MKLLDVTLQRRVERASKKLGLSEHEVVNRAVLTYLESVDDVTALNRELQMWDVLSAKTMQKYQF